MLNRRDTIKIGAAAAVALALPAQRLASALAGPPAPAEPFTVPLPISPVLEPVSSTPTGDYYHMVIKSGTAQILPGHDTPVLTFNGAFPGPTIRATRGRPATVKVSNELTTPTAVHLHGGNVPQHSDGHPLDPIQPGTSRTYWYPNEQPAATLWYHDHAHHLESEQIYRGLSGFYLIDDPRSGVRSRACDIPLALRDVAFTDSGELLWELGGFRHRTTVLVNGAIQPVHTVERRRYRLRLLNCANERSFRLRLGGAEMLQIGVDGGLLPAPIARTEILLSPAERVDVVVDFSRFDDGSSVILENADGDANVNRNILMFRVSSNRALGADDLPVWTAGAPVLPAVTAKAVTTRKITFGFNRAVPEFLINGKTFDPNRVDFTVKQGSTEIWEIFNDPSPIPIPHSLHLHLVQFRVLDRDGVPVQAWEAYPKDTVYVAPGQTVRIQVTFDSRFTGRYPFHCHYVDHSSIGMMAQMEIVP